MMKIIYVDTVGSWGGVATYLRPLLKNQVNQHNQVYLLTGTKGELTKWVSDELPTIQIIILPTLKRNIHILDTLKAIFQFRKIVKQISPDIIHLNCIMSGLVGRLGVIGLSTKVIYNAHGWAFEPRVNKKMRILAIIIEKLLSYLTSNIICVSNYEYNIANKYHIFKNNQQGIVIKNGSPDVLNDVKQISSDHNEFNITMAARFASPKDQMLLIKSFYELLHKYDFKEKICLYLLGNGPTLTECKKEVTQLHLDNNVIFTGEISNFNVLKYYRKSNLVILITKSEAISLSLIEAMSVKRAIIGSNVGGIPELIYHNGLCVANNVNSITEALISLIKYPYRIYKMDENSYNIYKKYYTQDIMINKTNDLYNEVLHK